MMDIYFVAAVAAIGTPVLGALGWLLDRFVLHASQRSRISVSIGIAIGVTLAMVTGSVLLGLGAIPGMAVWAAMDIAADEDRTVRQFWRDAIRELRDNWHL